MQERVRDTAFHLPPKCRSFGLYLTEYVYIYTYKLPKGVHVPALRRMKR